MTTPDPDAPLSDRDVLRELLAEGRAKHVWIQADYGNGAHARIAVPLETARRIAVAGDPPKERS